MIRRIEESDAEAYFSLRHASLLDAPLAFASSPEDDLAASAEAVREMLRSPTAVIFGAFEPELVGAVGLYRDRHVKAAHKAHIWGMYVAPEFRGQGIAATLLHAALEHARSMPGVECVHLSVSSAAQEARRLYERAGFQPWGTEPDALRRGGEAASQAHMALRL